MRNGERSRIYYPGMPETIELPEVPIRYLLKGSKEKYGDRIAYIFRDQVLTFNELYTKSWMFANALKEQGVKKGDVILTYLPTCIEYFPIYYGIVLSGAVISPINPLSNAEELKEYVIRVDAKCVIAHETNAERLNDVIHHTEVNNVIVVSDSSYNPATGKRFQFKWTLYKDCVNYSRSTEFDVNINPKEDLAHLPFTGGTTGRPKAVMQTHYNVVSSTLISAAWFSGVLPVVSKEDEVLYVRPVEADERKFLKEFPGLPGTGVKINSSPLFHATGMLDVFVYSVLLGSTTVLMERFDPGLFLECAEKYRATEITGAPAMFTFLLRHPDVKTRDLTSIRMINSGAAPISEELMKALHAQFPSAVVTEAYGLTETTGLVSSGVVFRSGCRKLGTVGFPVFNTEVKLVPLDGEAEEPAINQSLQEGEIWVRGPQVMKGYYKDQDSTKSVITEDGWLKTGDIGRFDEDGMLSIIDRKKDMLIYKGYNVYPRELEEILYQHPAVVQAAVIGKQDPDVGEIPKAFVVLKPGAQITEQELMDFVNTKVLPYKKIRELVFTDQLPMSPAGKILKRALRSS